MNNILKPISKYIKLQIAGFTAMLPRKANGVAYKLVMADIDTILSNYKHDKEYSERIRFTLSMTGGACATEVTQEAIDIIVKRFKDSGKPYLAFLTKLTLKPTMQIVLVEDYLSNLTTLEKKAIYLHEVGHLVNGDLNNVSGVIIDETKEIAADAYAAKQVGKKVVRSALRKMVDNTIERMIKDLNAEQVAEMKDEYANGIMSKRLAALI